MQYKATRDRNAYRYFCYLHSVSVLKRNYRTNSECYFYNRQLILDAYFLLIFSLYFYRYAQYDVTERGRNTSHTRLEQ